MSSGAGDVTSPPIQDQAERDGHTPGALLRQERLRRGLSVQQAAEGLHLDPWIIEAIEANHFLALGAPVYAKGYLRKFALLLDLAPDVIVARYEGLTDTPAVPTPVPIITTTPPPRPKWPKVVAWCLGAAIVAGVGWAAFELLMPPSRVVNSGQLATEGSMPSSAVPAPAAQTPPEAVSMPTTVDAPAMPQTVPASQADTSAVVEPPSATTAPVSAEPRAASSPSDGDNVTRLRLEFSESSWVEIYDANGQRLLYDVGEPGRARTVAGQAPLSVVIGLASAVSVQVNDRKMVVPRRANKDSARFVVNADGSVRNGSNR